MKEKALSCAGLDDLRLKFSPAWLRNSVAACGLARSTAACGGLRRRLWGLSVIATSLSKANALYRRRRFKDQNSQAYFANLDGVVVSRRGNVVRSCKAVKERSQVK